jgi:magnesium transporter
LKIFDLVLGNEIEIEQINDQDISNLQLEIRDLREKDLEIISEKFKIDLVDIEDIYDQDERPRVDVDIQNQYIEVVLRFPLDFYEEEKSLPIICFIKPKSYCLILHQHENFICVQTKQTKKIRAEVLKNNDLLAVFSLLKFLTGIALQTEKIIRQLQRIKDELENQIFKSRETSGLKDVFHLSKSVVLFENNMKGNLIQVRKLIKHETLEIQTNSEIISKFDDLETDFEQYYDQIRIMREILNSSLDAYGGIVSNNLNEVMKTLTIFTILLSNPILIASVYGMNINLPFADHPFSLYFLLIFSILLSGIMILYMKRRNIL